MCGNYKPNRLRQVLFLLVLAVAVYGVFEFLHIDQPTVISGMSVSQDRVIEYDGSRWRMTFESEEKSIYVGKIRHISRNNERKLPVMTHDLLVTSGDFTEEDKVKTIVIHHVLVWRGMINKPSGRINLIHAIPADISIYRKIEKIGYGTIAEIEGYEVKRITSLQDNGYWKDKGCSTLYVTRVEIKE